MAETAADSRVFSLCFTKPLLICALVSVSFLVLSCFIGLWFLPLLVTTSVLVLSSVLLVTFTKKKVILDGNPNPVQDDELMPCSSKNLLKVEMDAPGSEELQSETETVALQQNVTHQVKGNQILHEHAFKYPENEIEMESESDDGNGLIRSQNLVFNWFCADNVDEESTETSDDSVSASSDDEDNGEDDVDDDSLIEIALPGEEPKQKLQSNLAEDLLSGSIFGQQDLVELLEEINEEDNLIEIDISMFDVYELDVKSRVS